MKVWRILIVDDEVVFTRLLELNLERTGMFQVRAENRARLAVFSARLFRPDLVLLDRNMPELDGTEVAAALRADPIVGHVPIIFLTGSMEIGEGDEKVILKPVSLADLVLALSKALDQDPPPPRNTAKSATFVPVDPVRRRAPDVARKR